jgi:hypothetical protein
MAHAERSHRAVFSCFGGGHGHASVGFVDISRPSEPRLMAAVPFVSEQPTGMLVVGDALFVAGGRDIMVHTTLFPMNHYRGHTNTSVSRRYSIWQRPWRLHSPRPSWQRVGRRAPGWRRARVKTFTRSPIACRVAGTTSSSPRRSTTPSVVSRSWTLLLSGASIHPVQLRRGDPDAVTGMYVTLVITGITSWSIIAPFIYHIFT